MRTRHGEKRDNGRERLRDTADVGGCLQEEMFVLKTKTISSPMRGRACREKVVDLMKWDLTTRIVRTWLAGVLCIAGTASLRAFVGNNSGCKGTEQRKYDTQGASIMYVQRQSVVGASTPD